MMTAAVLSVLLALVVPVMGQNNSVLVGKWEGTRTTQRGVRTQQLTFSVEAGKLVGTTQGRQGDSIPLTNLKLENDGALSYTITMRRGERSFEMNFTGKVADGTISGTYGTGERAAKFTAKRVDK